MAWKPDYCTLQELRTFLGVPADQTADDALLALDIAAASRSLDNHCNRQFGKTDAPEARYYQAQWWPGLARWVVLVDDLMVAPADIEVDGSTVLGATLYPRNAAADGKPWTRLQMPDGWPCPTDREVAVTATWGWSAVPTPVKLATLMQASRFAARRDSPYGVAGSPDLGSEIRLQAKVDPDIPVISADFVRQRVLL